MIWLLAKIVGIALGVYLVKKNNTVAKVIGWILIIIQVLDILVVLT